MIFLDFDGVIRMPVFGGPEIEAEFCSERMRRVTTLAEENAASIVISSDWRLRFDFDGIANLLEPAIPRELLHRDWQTPVFATAISELPVPRGAEIVTWLFRNPETDHFVILDDLASHYFPAMESHFVKCDLTEGLTEERFATAAGILKVGDI